MSGYSISLTHEDVFAVIQPWIAAVTGLSPDVVVQAMGNRTPTPPPVPGYVVMTITAFKNLRTPILTWDQSQGGNPDVISSESGTRLLVQLDFISGPGVSPGAGDWAKMVSGLWRTEMACAALAPTCAPLHADEAMMAPLTDEEDQYEQRWTLQAYVQYNPVTTAPMQFADQAEVTLVNVDKAYPP
jgi:hypothetical protein